MATFNSPACIAPSTPRLFPDVCSLFGELRAHAAAVLFAPAVATVPLTGAAEFDSDSERSMSEWAHADALLPFVATLLCSASGCCDPSAQAAAAAAADPQMRKRPAAGAAGGADRSNASASASAAAASAAASVSSPSKQSSAPIWLPSMPLMLLLYFSLLLGIAHLQHTILPAPLDAEAPAHRFSEGRAREHLHALTSYGIRTTGSQPNEVLAVRYILGVLRDLQMDLASRPESSAIWELQVQLQRPSGSFDLDFLGGFTSSYTNVTNILARIAPKGSLGAGSDRGAGGSSGGSPAGSDAGGSSSRGAGASLLVSGHFDSALGTPAATDDVANCANMLEVLRSLLHRPPSEGALAAPVIFLWNGAEETILQASHGFITQHPWAKHVAAFINLEGAGGSGREIVFQTGPLHQWIAEAYSAAAPYPFASVLAQDVFQSGAIPSDTDFRVFRDFGRVPGMDVAYIDNGYIYHTRLDTEDRVSAGALQRCGENLVATITALAESPFLVLTHREFQSQCKAPNPGSNEAVLAFAHDVAVANGLPSPLSPHDLRTLISSNVCLDVSHSTGQSAVYFDLLGLMVVIFSVATSQRLNWGTIALVVVYLGKQMRRRRRREAQLRAAGVSPAPSYGFPALVGLTLVSFVFAMVCAMAVGALLLFVAPMSWFSHPALIAGLFVAPALLGYATAARAFFASVGREPVAGAHKKDASSSAAALLPPTAGLERASLHDSTQPAWLRRAFEREEVAYDAALAIWGSLLLVLTVLRIGSSFMALAWCLIPLFARSLARHLEVLLFSLERRMGSGARPHTSAGVVPALAPSSTEAPKGLIFLVAYLLGLTLPAILFLQASAVMLGFFVPLMGRAGTMVPSDLLIAGLFSMLLGIAGWMCLSVVHLLCNWRVVRNTLLACMALSLLFALTPLGLSYSETTPKRIYIQHVARVKHEAGFDSFGDVRAKLTENSASAAATVGSSSSSPSAGSLARARRSALRDANPSHDTSLWLIAMDYQNIAPLRKVRVPAALLGLPTSNPAANAADATSASPAAAVGEDGTVNLLSLGAEVACARPGVEETRSRLFCDLPYFLPLPSFVPGNWLIPLPASDALAPPEALRPRLRLQRVEHLAESATTDAGAAGAASLWTRRRRLHFEVSSGPSHMTLFINNRAGFSRVQQWSLGGSIEDTEATGKSTLGSMYEKQGEGNPAELFVYFASGMPLQSFATDAHTGFDAASLLEHAVPPADDQAFTRLPRSWSFWVEVADAVADADAGGVEPPYLDLAIAGHYLIPDLNSFIEQAVVPFLPRWITPVWFTSFHDSFKF